MRRRFETYLDGEADPDLAARVAKHLEQCWSCSEDAEWIALVKGALIQLGRRRPPDLAVARLRRYASSLDRQALRA